MVTGNWHVLGAGAQGLLFYAYARRAQQPWRVIARQCPPPDVLLTYETDGALSTLPLVCTTLSPASSQLARVVIAVKTTQLTAALQQVRPHLAADADVVLALNGVGWLAGVQQMLPSQRLWILSSIHGSYRRAPWHVVDSGRDGRLFLGAASPGTSPHPALLALWQSIGFHCEWDHDIVARLWRKAALNACINPLTALLNCRNGELLTRPAAMRLLPALYDELSAVLNSVDASMTADELSSSVARACQMTANNFSSMQQDLQAGRETEIDAIVGAFIRQAQHINSPLSAMSVLYDAIAQRENWSRD